MKIEVMAFELEDFERLSNMRQQLHNSQRSMTFDEQRDFAERLRLLLEHAQLIDLPAPEGKP